MRFFQLSLRGAQATRQSRVFFWIASLMLAMTISSYAHAQESTLAPAPAEYSPAPCEFTLTFPFAPELIKKCAPLPENAPEGTEPNCAQQAQFTKVFAMSGSINIRATCSANTDEIKEKYSLAVMEGTLRAMADIAEIKTYSTASDETEHYKQATITGEGMNGVTPTIFIGQLWVGDKSFLSIEAEITGEAETQADTMFRDILKSIEYKGTMPSQSESAPP